jgi:hypothetical protein
VKKRLVVKRGAGFEPKDEPPAYPHAARMHVVTPAAPPDEGRKVRQNGTRKKTVYLPDSLCTSLRHHCATYDTDETKVVIKALERYLRQP